MCRVFVCVSLVLWGVVGVASGALAQTPPPIANRPAATLLLPYFEVDLDDQQGVTTLFSVNNASASAAVAHVTLWSDMGVPVFGFNIYLTGYDVQTINLRDILVGGVVPRTADDGADVQDTGNPNDGISNQGILSQDINFPGSIFPCSTPVNNTLNPVYLPYLRSALTGGPSSFHAGMCVAQNHGTPSLARGYVTVNTVTQCALLFPSDVGYFSGGIADARNILWGDYMMVNQKLEQTFSDSLVHITTSGGGPPDPELITPGRYTFWGRYTNWLATDGREPLATNFAARFVGPKDFETVEKVRRRPFFNPSTEVIVWRDPKVDVDPFACGSQPGWFPLNQEQIVVFDEQEGVESPTFASPPFPGATQRVTLASAAFPVTFDNGWLYLNLNTFVPQAGPNPSFDPGASQAWVSVLHRVAQGPNGGRYEVGVRAIRLDSARNASHAIIP